MSPIDPAVQAAALVRRSIVALRPQGGPSATAAQGATGHRRAHPIPPTATLASSALNRIRGLPADDPTRGRKAFRIYLETALLQALGLERTGDPAIENLIDETLARMEADQALASAVAAAGSDLVADPEALVTALNADGRRPGGD